MWLMRTRIWLPVLALSGCLQAPASEVCAGREKITGQDASVVWLAQNDTGLLKGIIKTDEFGQAQGCWK